MHIYIATCTNTNIEEGLLSLILASSSLIYSNSNTKKKILDAILTLKAGSNF